MLNKTIKRIIAVFVMSVLPVFCFLATVASSLAWFTYNTNSEVFYSGTTISTNDQLQIGIKTDMNLSAYGLTNENGYAWAQPGAGLSSYCLNTYLEISGYASTAVAAVTSAEYSEGDNISFYRAPSDEVPGETNEANNEYYVKIPLVFRILNIDDNSYIKNKEIWLSDAFAKGQGNNVENGIRIHFQNDQTGFIVNPMSTESGKTRVAGPLDLNDNGYYDSDFNGNEVMYGYYDKNIPIQYEHQENSSQLDDVNHTGDDTPGAFYSKHASGINKISNVDEIATKYADYYCLNDVKPDKTNGYLAGGKPIATTSNSDDGIAEVTMCIWLEGWDFAVVDKIRGMTFSLSLMFQINGK